MLTIGRPRDVAKEICSKLRLSMGSDGLKQIASIIEPMKLIRGKHPVQEGEVCNYIFYVQHGLILHTYRKNDTIMTENITHEGDFAVATESFFKRKPSLIEMETLEPSIIYGLPHDKLYELAQTSFDICRLIFSLEQYFLLWAQHRADAMRFETAHQRYVRYLQERPEIVRRAPVHNIASLLQMTRETLSRMRTLVHGDEKP